MHHAMERARTFAAALDLPEGWTLRYTGHPTIFSVKWRHPEYGQEFILVRIEVEEGTAVVQHDFRPAVQRILESPAGFAREAKLLEALKERDETTPDWFVAYIPAGSWADRKGVDGWAQISVKGTNLKFPIQVKSSQWHAQEFYKTWPEYRGVIWTIWVYDADSPAELRARMYALLSELRAYIIEKDVDVKDVKELITSHLNAKRQDRKAAAAQ